jgi:hypothetical protein|tara:strand:+ start:91 stop:237 length:147 start_codon:yes stop_codon:yes gene_type:complete
VKNPSISKLPEYTKDRVLKKLPEETHIEKSDNHRNYMEKITSIKEKYA